MSRAVVASVVASFSLTNPHRLRQGISSSFTVSHRVVSGWWDLRASRPFAWLPDKRTNQPAPTPRVWQSCGAPPRFSHPGSPRTRVPTLRMHNNARKHARCPLVKPPSPTPSRIMRLPRLSWDDGRIQSAHDFIYICFSMPPFFSRLRRCRVPRSRRAGASGRRRGIKPRAIRVVFNIAHSLFTTV